ncbi:MAG: aspartate racemase [Candidatus Fischerbacteria bacterium RBG_13_37_8]|uniref:Aspartate racemase n=1 Tax=Candidatus Fischerbacteria bacterium RBG_13_37_8 TaxID=1817863 RepID=A0A1F5VJR5_9BACT|nr:MAG: aspartate racemase [Candidatus Fischerbacteria bacterium RBG_13_37_8]
MTKHIGIVACSAEGAALCYRTICLEGAAILGRHNHPEVSMHTHPLGKYMDFIYEDNWNGVAELMLSSTRKLAVAGADFAICPDNTIHKAYELVIKESPIQWLHIGHEVAAEAKSHNYRHLALLGTRYLMEGPVYPDALAQFSMACIIPPQQVRISINEIIFDELVNGIINAQSRSFFTRVIMELKERGCDAVVLGCTEIPLIVRQEDSCLPILDSTRLLARAALRRAVA